tara:strand:+ start:31 stop:711 length:681 start_codon:yes stop_codon:yes gene_type:complete
MSDLESKFARSAIEPPKPLKKKTAPKSAPAVPTAAPQSIAITNDPASSATAMPTPKAGKVDPQDAAKQVRLLLLKKQLATFLGESLNEMTARRWIETGLLKIYLRKESRRGDSSLTIASVEVVDQERPTGFEDVDLFCEAIELIHKTNPYRYTFYETGDDAVLDYLRGQGWQDDAQPMCMFKEATLVKAPQHETGINDRIQRMREKARKKVEEANQKRNSECPDSQ